VTSSGPAPSHRAAEIHSAEPAPSEMGQPVAFAEVYEGHVDFVWRNLRRLGVVDACLDDAVQDVFIVVHRRLVEFGGSTSSVRAWLFAILRRVASDYRRAARRKGVQESLGDDLTDPSPSPHDATMRREAIRRLDEILAGLDEDKRIAFMLVEIEEMTVPEVAESLGINLNTAYSRLRLARAEVDAAVHRSPTVLKANPAVATRASERRSRP
jgi:RNA polymerase sigma-70 factor (ECF subfamily)